MCAVYTPMWLVCDAMFTMEMMKSLLYGLAYTETNPWRNDFITYFVYMASQNNNIVVYTAIMQIHKTYEGK